MEGRCQSFTVESERKVIQKINVLFGKMDALSNTVHRRGYQEPSAAADKDKPSGVVAIHSADNDLSNSNAIKEWALAQMKANYDDFDRLLSAKYQELRAMINANRGSDVDFSQFATLDDFKKIIDWIEFHEPKINLLVSRSDA